MGYSTDTHMSQFISPFSFGYSAGTWTPTIASNVVKNVRTAAGAANTILIPIPLPSNDSALKGARLKSIDVWWVNATADLAAFATVEVEKVALTANGSAVTGAAVTTTIDSNNDTEAKRITQASHKMTVTITTPEWIDDDTALFLELVITGAASSVLALFGARANYDLRV
jgi:hypothetical protein